MRNSSIKGITVVLFVLACLATATNAYAQGSSAYPQDYFRNPLDIPMQLAGNFGECRPGHFHSGLDIKTQNKENMPVHAAADGYISRIKMDKGGFGHALYITHANGYTTLYAHLNDFAPAIQKYLKEEQYKRKRWDVDITLPSTQFPVKQGELIAYSGNTGASTAPHLHFEIRNTKTEHPLNPQLFGLKVVDTIAPVVREVVLYWSNADGFYDCKRTFIPVFKRGNSYIPSRTPAPEGIVSGDTVSVPYGAIGVGVNLDDYMDTSGSTIAFYSAELRMDDTLQSGILLDDIGYDETRYMNAYMDYAARQKDHKWVQCLFKLPGNRLDRIYSSLNMHRGWLTTIRGKAHRVQINFTDNNGNKTVIAFYIRQDLRAGDISDGGHMAGGGVDFYCNRQNVFNNGQVAFELDDRQLYDNLYFRVIKQEKCNRVSDKSQLYFPYVPIHHYFDLRIKPNKNITVQLKDKIVMMYSDGKDEDGRAASVADSGWYKARVRNFGTYWLDVDTTAPVIESMQRRRSNLAGAKQIAFTVKDNMTSVRTFSGYIDGKWVCFEQHGDDFFYKFDEHCPKGKHTLVFKAADENGNEAGVTLNFVR